MEDKKFTYGIKVIAGHEIGVKIGENHYEYITVNEARAAMEAEKDDK